MPEVEMRERSAKMPSPLSARLAISLEANSSPSTRTSAADCSRRAAIPVVLLVAAAAVIPSASARPRIIMQQARLCPTLIPSWLPWWRLYR